MKMPKKRSDSAPEVQESPYVHRFTAYVKDLEKSCWAYENRPVHVKVANMGP